jgi:hypothetical protein
MDQYIKNLPKAGLHETCIIKVTSVFEQFLYEVRI